MITNKLKKELFNSNLEVMQQVKKTSLKTLMTQSNI